MASVVISLSHDRDDVPTLTLAPRSVTEINNMTSDMTPSEAAMSRELN